MEGWDGGSGGSSFEPMVEEGYDSPAKVKWTSETEQRERADKAIDEITKAPSNGYVICPECAGKIEVEQTPMETITHEHECKPFINGIYPRRAGSAITAYNTIRGRSSQFMLPSNVLVGWLKSWICWYKGLKNGPSGWNEADHKWVKTGQENHYDSSETWEFMCSRCGLVGHGGK